jgi:nucleoside phosphorylase
MQKICFIIAMKAEAKPLIERFGLQQIEWYFGSLPTQLYSGIINGKELSIVLNGQQDGLDLVGCEAATLTTELAISRLHPDLIINAGTCGAFKADGAHIGDVYLSQGTVMFHDRRVGDDGGWAEMGLGNYPCIDATPIAQTLGLKLGKCTTGSSLDYTDTDMNIMRKNGGQLKDMEAGAIAYVASLHKTPLLCVKSVTDLCDGGRATEEEFHENLTMASLALKDACTKIIEYLFHEEPQLF